MQAVILVGGFGRRLHPMVPDLPKSMAPVNGKPFLVYLLDYLAGHGVTDIIFSAHYLWGKIRDYFQSSYKGMLITYLVEKEPLGTGGAIVNALQHINSIKPVFMLNGDSFVKLDYRAMYKSRHALTIAICSVPDCTRYGNVMIEKGVITAFREKGEAGSGLINAGVYLLQPGIFDQFVLPEKFSFESDFLLPQLAMLKPSAFITNDYFVDIGVPEDYAKAGEALSS